MAQDNFIDYVKLYLRSGDGGRGSVHFFRAKGLPKGGPDGGNGGRGGDIRLRANGQLWTLLHLRYTKHIRADDGQPGAESNMTGADGAGQTLEVPVGTIIRDAETGRQIGEVTHDGHELTVLPGGRGGLGNLAFTTSTNRAPTKSQPGEPGQEGWFILELKLLADVGLVGFPNAGKSTLLSAMSAARPKIADYPFTTLKPNLGVIQYRGFRSFVMADIPGIIEGASEGRGLGLRFLRHIERNSILLFLLPIDSMDWKNQYEILLSELRDHNPELLTKERVIVISKADLADDEVIEAARKTDFDGQQPLVISAASQKGLEDLKDELWRRLERVNAVTVRTPSRPSMTVLPDANPRTADHTDDLDQEDDDQ